MSRRQDDYAEEIREHIEIETRENIERGMPPEEARRAAIRTFGNSGVSAGSICGRAVRSIGWKRWCRTSNTVGAFCGKVRCCPLRSY